MWVKGHDRAYEPSVRLLGYGLIAAVAGFKPRPNADLLWLLYGAAMVFTGVLNILTVNDLGSNDPRYAALAHEVSTHIPKSTIVATNSFHLLDLHAGIPSVPVLGPAGTDYDQFLWVTMPEFDPVARAVTPIPMPAHNWCVERHFTGATLFRPFGVAGKTMQKFGLSSVHTALTYHKTSMSAKGKASRGAL